jgi:Flp pilus assembly protein TadD
MKRIAGLLPAILLCAASLFAQGNPYPNPPRGSAAEAGTIQGRVSYPDGKPAVNVELDLEPQSSWGTPETTTTKGAGTFSFSNLAVGSEYSITGSVAGFRPIRRIVLVSGEVNYVNISLTPFPGQPIPPTATVPARYASVPPDALELFRRGVRAQDDGKVKEAEADFRKAISVDPSFAGAYMHLSAVYAYQNRFDEARKAIRKSLKLSNHSADAYAYLGYLYIREKRADKAEAAIRKSLAISNKDWLAHLEMGRLRYEQKQYAMAYPELKLARKLRQQSPSANLLLYDVLIRLRKNKEALAELDDILKVFPKLPEAAKLKKTRPALAAIVNGQH